jgi:hypothetical protein
MARYSPSLGWPSEDNSIANDTDMGRGDDAQKRIGEAALRESPAWLV